jgi:hypothetical protein
VSFVSVPRWNLYQPSPVLSTASSRCQYTLSILRRRPMRSTAGGYLRKS